MTAGQPCGGYGAGRTATLAQPDLAPDSGWSGRGRHEGSISGWAEAAADSGRMCAAGGLREPGESAARARVERSRANIHTGRAGRLAMAPGAQGTDRVGAAGDNWRGFGRRGRLWRDKADRVPGLPDWRP